MVLAVERWPSRMRELVGPARTPRAATTTAVRSKRELGLSGRAIHLDLAYLSHFWRICKSPGRLPQTSHGAVRFFRRWRRTREGNCVFRSHLGDDGAHVAPEGGRAGGRRFGTVERRGGTIAHALGSTTRAPDASCGITCDADQDAAVTSRSEWRWLHVCVRVWREGRS